MEASSERTDGGAFARVPGCVYATITPAGERAAKASQLREFLERARLIEPGDTRLADTPVAGVGEEPTGTPGYRNKVVYHFAKTGGKWVIGYRTEPSHEIVDIESDPLAATAINAKLPEIRRSVLALLTTGPETVRRDIERKGNVTVRWTAKSGVKWWIGDAPRDLVLKETTCGLDFEVPADGFYQVNPRIGEALARAVTAAYAAGAATAPEVVDLYCGVGVLGLACRAPRLTGVESGRQAVEFARRNAAAQQAANARFLAEPVGRSLRRVPIGTRTTVIADPPRGGMELNVPQALAESKAPRLIYVSCDPATLVRDLKTLGRAYAIESVRWFDMFPRTARFETLVALNRR